MSKKLIYLLGLIFLGFISLPYSSLFWIWAFFYWYRNFKLPPAKPAILDNSSDIGISVKIPLPDHFYCPYCQGELPPPTRKRQCPHCSKIIYARTRPGKPQNWVKQEDLMSIMKEWADHQFDKYSETRTDIIQGSIEDLKDFKQGGNVKTMKIYTAEDDLVCPACKAWANKEINIDQAVVGKSVPPFPFCANLREKKTELGCRCYSRPEKMK